METDHVDVDKDLTIERGYVKWGVGPQSAQIATIEELYQLFDRIDSEERAYSQPVRAMVGLGGTRFLRVGLGVDETGLSLSDQSDWHSWVSLGDLYTG